MRDENIKEGSLGKYNQFIFDEFHLSAIEPVNFVNQKFIAKDNDGYFIKCVISDLKRGRCPNKFDTSNPYTIENIKNFCTISNIKDILVSDNYNGADKLLEWFCPVHNAIYKKKWNAFLYGEHCILCANERHGGMYHLDKAEEFKEDFIKIPANLYIIKCYNDKESFYKIGITKNDVQIRFKDKIRMPYNYDIIQIYNINLYDAIVLENKLHKFNKKYKYKPKITFGGHTECFNKIDLGGII